MNPTICIGIAEPWSGQKLGIFFFPLKEVLKQWGYAVFTQLGVLKMQWVTQFHAVYSEKWFQAKSFLNTENNGAWF